MSLKNSNFLTPAPIFLTHDAADLMQSLHRCADSTDCEAVKAQLFGMEVNARTWRNFPAVWKQSGADTGISIVSDYQNINTCEYWNFSCDNLILFVIWAKMLSDLSIWFVICPLLSYTSTPKQEKWKI